MKLSTKSRYAVEALLYMAISGDKNMNITQISTDTEISEKYLEQIFYTLRKNGILNTKRGPNGGYSIVPKLTELTVGDIIRAVENDVVPVDCIENPEKCVSGIIDTCVTRKLWLSITCTFNNVIDNITFDELKNEFLECAE